MAKHTLSPTTPSLTPGAVATVAALRELAAAASPDARLVTACERFTLITEEAHRLLGRARIKQFRATMQEHNALEAEIGRTPARSAIGRLAKAEVALRMMGENTKGTIWEIPRSALADFVRNASSGRDMKIIPPTLEEPPEMEEV